MRIVSRQELGELPPVEWLVANYIPSESLCMIWGKSESFKSFVALDIACSIATGKPWSGKAVDGPGDVMYVAAEGQRGIKSRIEAWEANNKVRADRLFVVPHPVLPGGFESGIRGMRAKGVCPRLVVVDTLSRCLAGEVDENSATGVEKFLGDVDTIRQEFSSSIMLIHHSDKIGGWPRGSYAISAAMDAIYQITRDGASCRMQCTKQKDADRSDALAFLSQQKLESLVLGKVGG